MAEFRQFDTGATRDLADGKYDYEGFLSPLVIERFGEYMHKNRHMKDGSLRDSDNWQKGIPIPQYFKSLWRHVFSAWKLYRGWPPAADGADQEENLCGVLFNTSGALHEILKAKLCQTNGSELTSTERSLDMVVGSGLMTGIGSVGQSRPCSNVLSVGSQKEEKYGSSRRG